MTAAFPGKMISNNDCETMLLIAQAVKSNLPLADAVRLSIEDASHPRGAFEKSLLRLAERLDKGDDPKLAVTQVGLPQPLVGMFEMALRNPDFAATFDELAQLEINRTDSINRIARAFAYPVFMFVMTTLGLLAFLIFIVPQFQAIFDEFGLPLPSITMIVLQISQLLRTGALVFGVIAFFIVLFVMSRWVFPRFWHLIPVFGSVGRTLNTCRMLRQMAWLVHQNVPLPEALEQCGKTMRNSAYRRDCFDAAESARKGMPFAEIALRYEWLFPAWLAPMVAAAGSGEALARSLRRAAETVEQQKNGALMFVQSLSMPLFITIMIYGCGFAALAMILPMFNLITALSSPF